MSDIICRQLRQRGQTVQLGSDSGWRSEPYHALLQPLRYKNKMYLEDTPTPIGDNEEKLCLYIGPPDHDVTRLGAECYLMTNGYRYQFVQSERMRSGEETIYLWGVVRRYVESETPKEE